MFVGLRDLWFAKGRFMLMTTVVTLVALLVVVLSGLTAGLAAENVSAVEGLGASHLVFQDTGEDPSFEQSHLDASQKEQWVVLPGVTAAAPLGISRASMTVADSSIPVVVFAAEPGSFIGPTQLETDATVVVSSAFADEHHLSSGGRVTIGEAAYTVATTTGESSFAHSPVVWIRLGDWQQLAGTESQATVIALQTDGALDDQSPIDGTVVETVNQSLQAVGSFTEENGSLQMIRGFLLVISALVIGAFFTVWTIQRRHDIAVLKAMGASTPYLLGDALGQATIVLVAAAVTGGGIGFLVGQLVSGTVPFVSDMATTLYPLVAMVAIGLVGAGLAIRSVTNVDPLTALGGSK